MPNKDPDTRDEFILDHALDLAGEDRAAYIEEACQGDPKLLERIWGLVSAFEEAGAFLEHPVGGGENLWQKLRGKPEKETRQSFTGTVCGQYRLLDEIGRGGMGVVYLAERIDGQFEQKVAIKLIHYGARSPMIKRRFLEERQILAKLQHPNIARLLDGGVSPDGFPYYVMEYIEGRCITEYCECNALSIPARLRLFIQVCRGVQYAHRNLIVHRDLKPGNILVTEDGHVKLLDFGIAKILSQDKPSGRDTLTLAGLYIMTPAYASPEQLRGESVTTTTDVYALGLMLFELLTGRPPFDISGLNHFSAAEHVLKNEPPKPSAALMTADPKRSDQLKNVAKTRGVSLAKLRRLLKGDLDAICLYALQKEPDRRYATPDILAADIICHLDGRPIRILQGGVWNRVRKFTIRNQWASIIFVMSLVLFAGFSLLTLVQSERIKQQSQSITEDLAISEEIADFMLKIILRGEPAQFKNDPAVYEMLYHGELHIADDLKDRPRLQASLMSDLGMIYLWLGDLEHAKPLLTKAYLVREGFHDNKLELAESLHRMGLFHQKSGHVEQAQLALEEAVQILTSAADAKAYNLARCRIDLGEVLIQRELFEEAEIHLINAYQGLNSDAEPDHGLRLEAEAGLFRLYNAWRKPDQAEEFRQHD